MTDAPKRRLTVETSNKYVYDPERVQALYKQLQPDPELYGDDPVQAVFSYLDESMLGADVFEDQGDYDRWFPAQDEEVET